MVFIVLNLYVSLSGSVPETKILWISNEILKRPETPFCGCNARIYNVLTRTKKIVYHTKGLASGPLFRHGGTGWLMVFF